MSTSQRTLLRAWYWGGWGVLTTVSLFALTLPSCGPGISPFHLSCKMDTQWNTFFDYNSTFGGESHGTHITWDLAGNLYFQGGRGSPSAFTNDVSGTIIRVDANGSSFTSLTLDQVYSGAYNYYFALLPSASGKTLVAAEYGYDGTAGHAIFKRSTDSGATWTTVLNYQRASGQDTRFAASAQAPDGSLYVGGLARDAGGIAYWMIMKSTDQGQSWSTVDDFQLTAGDDSQAWALAVDRSGVVYASGMGEVSNVRHAVIRKSSDGGSSWQTLDDYSYLSTKDSHHYGLALSSTGIHGIGYGIDSGNKGHWIVRSSSDGGSSWTLTDDYQLSTAGTWAVGRDIEEDYDGNLYATGYANDSGGVYHSMIRKSSDQGRTWTTMDDYVLATGQSATSYRIMRDLSGNLYSSGYAKDSGGTYHWLVRKLGCNPR